MGIISSKPILASKEAANLLGPTLWSKLDHAFRRLGDGRVLDAKTFHRHVLAGFPMMPKVLVDRWFDALDPSGRGYVTQQDFMCGLAVVLCGKPEERLRLLFQIYDTRRSGFLELEELRRLLDIAYSHSSLSSLDDGNSPVSAAPLDAVIAWLFRDARRPGELEYDEFRARMAGTAAANRPGQARACFLVQEF